MARQLVLAMALMLASGLLAAYGGDVASYRGPQNNGIYEEKGLLKAWPPEGPPLLWKAKLDCGFGGVSVVDGIVWVGSDSRAHLYGFTLEGEQKFKYPFGSTAFKRFHGPRCTPVIRDNIAVVSRLQADIHGIDLRTGKILWSVNAWKDFGSGKGTMGWGFPSSFPIFENKIILNPVSRDDKTPPVVAVDITTGKTLWQAEAGVGKRYSCGDTSGVVFGHNGRWLNVNPTWRYILCLDPRDGKRLWEVPDINVKGGSEKGLSPTYGDGFVVFDRSGLATCIQLNEDGTDYKPMWSRQYGGGFSHAVILGKRVYMAGDLTQYVWGGQQAIFDAGKNIPPLTRVTGTKAAPLPPLPGGLVCLDAQSGQVLDVVRMAEGLGHVISADGMIYAIDYDRGPRYQEGVSQLGLNVFLLKPTEIGMELAGRFRLPMTEQDSVRELEWQANINPVIAHGRLFIRYGPLWVYDVRAKGGSAAALPAVPAGGYWDFCLRGFVDGKHDLWVTLQVKDSAIINGVGYTHWNRSMQGVDTSALKLTPQGLDGTLTVTLNSATAVPADKKPTPLQVKLEAGHTGTSIAGKYQVEGGAAGKVDGRITGK